MFVSDHSLSFKMSNKSDRKGNDMKEFMIPSKGKGELHCCKWDEVNEIKGVVQLVHGICEHVSRYAPLAEFLNAKGYVVVGEDHMGHGGSIAGGSTQGYFDGGWRNAVDDTYALCEKTKAEYPSLPYFIYGHSMGSFLTRTILYRYPEAGFAGAVISGTGWQPKPVLKLGKAVCKMQARHVGETNSSPIVSKLMFGNYNNSYENPRTVFDWLSRDPAVVDDYIADPLSGFEASVGLSGEMLGGMEMNQRMENLLKMPKNLPVLFVAGDHDPVGSMGKGVQKTAEAFRKAGLLNVTVKLYPQGRHEMHNELNKDEVYADVLKFLNKHS